MPQSLQVPNWYNDDTYIKDKVTECNTIKFGAVDGEEFKPWNEASVRDFLAGANDEDSYAPWMGYENFVNAGNAENCSPNPLFNVMEYVYAKAEQLNAMNDGAGYGDNANNWTGQLVLDYFKANNISAWDHFTTAGQFENVNPSNAMDLSDFLANKAAQCNELQFDGREDWTPETVLEYYRDHGLNAVEVAARATDPNVVAVPADEAVTVPANSTPWGEAGSALVDVQLTAGTDVVSDNGVPTNFIGTVESSSTKSTLNPSDQITGTNDDDVLTVAMSSAFRGFDKNGFMTDVETVNLTNTSTGDRDLTFNTQGITGADTYNINGNIGLDRLADAGITINLNNVNTNTGVDFSFADGVTAGPDDALTIGLQNVYIPGTNDQPATAVSLRAHGIEDVTINATGTNTNIVKLDGIDYMSNMTVTGDGQLKVVSVADDLRTIDASEATGNLNLNVTAANITSATLGEGNDTLTVNSINRSAPVNGGSGDDTLVLNPASGTYALHMDEVESLKLNTTTSNVTLDGSDVNGMDNLILDNTGYQQSNQGNSAYHQIDLAHFNNSELNVQAVHQNTAGLLIADIPNVNVRVGDGVKDTVSDSFYGGLVLGNAEVLTVDATDAADQGARFSSTIDAANVNNLNLNAGRQSYVTVQQGSNLSNVSQIDVSGVGDVTINPGDVSTLVNTVNVDTSRMNDGSFTATFQNNINSTGKAALIVDGGTLADNNIIVDNTYSTVDFTAGQGNDTLTITANAALGDTVAPTISGNLGGGENTVYVDTVQDVDLSKLQGTGRLVSVNGGTWTGATDGWTVLDINDIAVTAGIDTYPNNMTNVEGTQYNDTFKFDIVARATSAVVNGMGGTDTYEGTINAKAANVSIFANNGAADITFATAEPTDSSSALVVENVQNLSITGGSAGMNEITGTVGNVSQGFTLNNTNSYGLDLVDLSVAAQGNVNVTGSTGTQNSFAVSVTQADDVAINTGNAVENAEGSNAGAYVSLAGITGDSISVTGGTGDDLVVVNGLAATKAADATFDVSLAGGNDTIQFTGTNNLTGWNADITGVETIQNDGTLNLGALVYGADISTDTAIVQTEDAAALTMKVSGTVDLAQVTKGSTNLTAAADTNLTLHNEGADTIVLGSDVSAAAAQNVVISGFDTANDKIDFDGFLSDFQATAAAGKAAYEAFTIDARWADATWATIDVTGVDSESVSIGEQATAGAASDAYPATVTVSLSGALDNDKIYIITADINSASDIAALFGTDTATVLDDIELASDGGGTIASGNIAADTLDDYLLAASAELVIVANSGADAKIWYINDKDGNASIDAASEVMLIGTLTGVDADTLTAANFA